MSEDTDRELIRINRWALSRIAREHRLMASESWTLLCLVLLASSEDESWVGFLNDLADDVGMKPQSVKRALSVLEREGLITLADPFSRHRPGRIVVNVYEDFTGHLRSLDNIRGIRS